MAHAICEGRATLKKFDFFGVNAPSFRIHELDETADSPNFRPRYIFEEKICQRTRDVVNNAHQALAKYKETEYFGASNNIRGKSIMSLKILTQDHELPYCMDDPLC